MACNHYNTKRSKHIKNMEKCENCGTLIDRHGHALNDNREFSAKGDTHPA